MTEAPTRTLAGSSARSLGAYYTPAVATEYMARWAVRTSSDRVLEPSMGDGEFLRAVGMVAPSADGSAVELWGVELAEDTYAAALLAGVVDPDHALLGDFLAVKPFEVDVVIGNPPYVRLRHLPKQEAERAQQVSTQVLGGGMDPAGSLWMPFVLHATKFLGSGGRLAFVLPYEMTYVRYARPLWRFLARTFRHLRVVRVHERVFPDILQDVVMLFADGCGGSTDFVDFEAYESADALDGGHRLKLASIPVARVAEGERPFLEALIPEGLQELLTHRLASTTQPVRAVASFNIGYVTGDKDFFHPNIEVAMKHGLPPASLRPALTSSRRLTRRGIWTSALPANSTEKLFLPPAHGALTDGERGYIELGEETGVNLRYKCRIRRPWYVTPWVKVPDLVVPVFAEGPLLLVNDGSYVASNSLLAGYMKVGTARQFAAAWYTTLTLLQAELNVHHLGGGVMVFVPREAGAMRLSRHFPSDAHLKQVDERLRRGDLDGAYAAGDDAVLKRLMGLRDAEIGLVRDGVAALRHWRSARLRGETAST